MANAEANQMIVSDAIVPQSELEQVMALDRTSRAVSKQLLEMAGNEAAKALIIARSIKQFRSLLTDNVMRDIMELQNNPLGFRTDKTDSGYPIAVVRDCVTQAFMRGLRVSGNEFNIIAGNLYVTKEGFERLLAEMDGLANLQIQIGVPSSDTNGALVPAQASWNYCGQAMSMEWQKGVADYRIPIRVNKAMGIDAIMGKAKSKVLRHVYARITGSKLLSEADFEDVESPETEVA